jgi:hypothetical protein
MATTTETISPYHKWVKPRMDKDPEYKEKVQMIKTRCLMKKYNEDQEFREKQNEASRNAHRKRYAEDPEYRQKKIDQAMLRYIKKKELKEAENQ